MQNHIQDRLHRIVDSATQRRAPDQQPAEPRGVRAQLAQRRPDLGRHALDQSFGRGAAVEFQIYPERAQHRREEALSGAVEPRDPRGWDIAASPDRGVERLQHALQPVCIGALADKGLQLLAQNCFLLGVRRKQDLRHTAIGEPVFGRVVSENVLVQHGSTKVCRGNGDGEVVPAVAGVEQPIDTAAVSAGKRNQQATGNVAGHFVEQGRGAGQPKQ